MRAWRLHTHGEPRDALRLDEIPAPEPGPGELRVRVAAAGLGFPDVLMCRNAYAFEPPRPATLGQEVCGIVEAVGEGSETPVGTRITGVTSFFTGRGGLAEQAIVLDGSAFAVPDTLPDAEAAGFVIPYHTAMVGLVLRARMATGETLLVLGAAGGSGVAAIQVGKALGARVIAVAGGAAKAEACRAHGADEVIDHRATPLREALAELGGERGFDVVYDPVGGESCETVIPRLASEGRLLAVGYASGAWHDAATRWLVQRNASMLGVYTGAYRKPALIDLHERLLAWWEQGALRIPVGAEWDFEQAAEALQTLAARTANGKQIIRVR